MTIVSFYIPNPFGISKIILHKIIHYQQFKPDLKRQGLCLFSISASRKILFFFKSMAFVRDKNKKFSTVALFSLKIILTYSPPHLSQTPNQETSITEKKRFHRNLLLLYKQRRRKANIQISNTQKYFLISSKRHRIWIREGKKSYFRRQLKVGRTSKSQSQTSKTIQQTSKPV